MSINLGINQNNISPEEWISVYEESLQLRENAFGDIKLFKQAETFSLMRSLDNYMTSDKTHNPDVYFMLINNESYSNVFSSKTQGFHYHNYILGVACLVEHRLKPDAVVHGDIYMGQIKDAVSWVNSILDTPIEIPDRCSKEKLWDRIQGFPPSEISLADQMKRLLLTETVFQQKTSSIMNEESIEIMDTIIENRMAYDICYRQDFETILNDLRLKLCQENISLVYDIIRDKSEEERKFILTNLKTPFLIRKETLIFMNKNLMNDSIYAKIIKLLDLTEQNKLQKTFFNSIFNNTDLLKELLSH